jgi:hypothetical protein
MTDPDEKINLEPPPADFEPTEDKRPRVEVPPPVSIEAVDDCSLLAQAGLERELDDFYVDLLKFDRDGTQGGIVFRADNFRVRFSIVEVPPPRTDYRPLMLTIPSLNELIERLREAEIEFQSVRLIALGMQRLLLADPAGNPLEISEKRIVI